MWAHSCGSACYSAELSVLRLEAPDRAERLFTNIAFPLMATRPLLQTSRRERPETEMGAASEISGVENLMTCANSVGSSSFLSLCRAKCMLSGGGGNNGSSDLLLKKFYYQEKCFISFQFMALYFCAVHCYLGTHNRAVYQRSKISTHSYWLTVTYHFKKNNNTKMKPLSGVTLAWASFCFALQKIFVFFPLHS